MAFKESIIVDQSGFDSASRKRNRDFENRQLDKKVEVEELSDAWETLLSLFGTEKARNNFLKLCNQYKKELVEYKEKKVKVNSGGELVSPDSKKAVFHNEIMEIIQKLNLAKNWGPEIQPILTKLQDRHLMTELIDRNVDYKP